MQPIDRIELQLKDIKIELPAYILKDFKSEMEKKFVQEAYRKQTENEKMLPLSRFWKNANISSLKERCAQFIAEETVKNDFNYDRRKLPSDLNELIDKNIEHIGRKIKFEVISKEINKNVEEEINKKGQEHAAFVSSLRRY
jgi:hypothetical protein